MGIITNVILPLALALIMFTMGLGLTGRDFGRVFKQPRDFFVGAGLQLFAGFRHQEADIRVIQSAGGPSLRLPLKDLRTLSIGGKLKF